MKGSKKAADVFYDTSLQALDIIIYELFADAIPAQLWESAEDAAKKLRRLAHIREGLGVQCDTSSDSIEAQNALCKLHKKLTKLANKLAE